MPQRILYVQHTADLYGASRALLNLLGALDRSQYTPLVALPGAGPLVAHLHALDVPIIPAPYLQTLWGHIFRSWRLAPFIVSQLPTALLLRRALLQHLQERGFGPEVLAELQILIEAQDADLYDVLAYVAYALPPKTRAQRAAHARVVVDHRFLPQEQVFLHGVLSHYVDQGVQALDPAELPPLLKLRYGGSLQDAIRDLGPEIGEKFAGFQRYLYEDEATG